MSTTIIMARGSARRLIFELTDSETGEPLPLVDRFVELCVVTKLGAETEILTKSTQNVEDGTVTDAAGGVAEIYIYSSDTEDIPPGSYRYDVWVIEDPEHEYSAIVGGNFTIIQRGCVMPGGT